jgi:hypothetical protein
MNTEEKNMLMELIDQLNSNRTILRAMLNLAIDNNKTLVPFAQDALEQNETKIEKALELIERRYR